MAADTRRAARIQKQLKIIARLEKRHEEMRYYADVLKHMPLPATGTMRQTLQRLIKESEEADSLLLDLKASLPDPVAKAS